MSAAPSSSESTALAEVRQVRNVLKVPTDEQIIVPGAIQQLMVKPDMSGTLLGVMLGPNAKAHKLFAGTSVLDVEGPIEQWRPNLPIKAGKFVILTVENTGDEPAVFRGLLLIDAPNHRIVVGAPQAPPPVEPEPEPEPASRVAAPMGLTNALPPEPTTTPEDHGVKAGNNEVAVIMHRNEVVNMLGHLRYNEPLTANVKHGLIRRLEAALKEQTKSPNNRRRR